MNGLNMAEGLTASYLPNLPNCNNHKHSYFQDHVKEGKVRDLHAHEHRELCTKVSAKSQALRATSVPTLPPLDTHAG